MTISSEPDRTSPSNFDEMVQAINARYRATTERHGVYTTVCDPKELYRLYLENLPESERQTHTCHTCRSFIEAYGNLVVIREDGTVKSAMWPSSTNAELGVYEHALTYMRLRVERSTVSGLFLSDQPVLGKPEAGGWTHMAVTNDKVFASVIKTPFQECAEVAQNREVLIRAIDRFPLEVVQAAHVYTQSDSLFRSDKIAGPIKWFLALKERLANERNTKLRMHLIWKAATEGGSYCHVVTSISGVLLTSILEGKPLPGIRSQMSSLLDPAQYQRPQVAPSAGNIAAAEVAIQKMGIDRSLKRRYARLDEIQTIWRPVVEPAKEAGVGLFSHLVPKDPKQPRRKQIELPLRTMTWVKFAKEVLPHLTSIRFGVPSHGNFIAMTTAVDPDAPPILQWDRPNERNPISTYVYLNGSSSLTWNLFPGWCDVTGICYRPAHWGSNPPSNHANGVTFLLHGARDTIKGQGSGLFPETLISELHPYRATIEAYSNSVDPAGRDEATACGYSFGVNEAWNCRLDVAEGDKSVQQFLIDRWD